jgi:hypothetical protein
MKYAVLITLHDGAYEAYGPFTTSRVERVREQAESLGWVERASVIPIHSPGTFRLEWREANKRVL